jgi:hypothetical protein
LSREHCVHTCDCLVESLRRRSSMSTLDERGATASYATVSGLSEIGGKR